MYMCHQLDAFFDGMLSGKDAAAFRKHLAECRACKRRFEQLHRFESLPWEGALSCRPSPRLKRLRTTVWS